MKRLSEIINILVNKSEWVDTETAISFSQASQTQTNHSQTVTKAGYYPRAILDYRFEGSGVGQMVPYAVYMNNRAAGTVKVNAGLRNNNPSSTITGTFYVRILWQKLGG